MMAYVTSNQSFTRKLADLGVPHEAEEFSGNPGDQYCGAEGRFRTRVLPLLGQHSEFNPPPRPDASNQGDLNPTPLSGRRTDSTTL